MAGRIYSVPMCICTYNRLSFLHQSQLDDGTYSSRGIRNDNDYGHVPETDPFVGR